MLPSTRSVLADLAHQLAGEGVAWQLGGSGLLFALQGEGKVGDLDLVFPADAGPGLGRVLERMSGIPADFHADQEPGFRSAWRCRHVVAGQDLDCIGGVVLQIGGVAVPVPFRPGSPWDLDGVAIPLAPIEHWALVYLHHASPKAELLLDALPPGRFEEFLAGLGISRSDLGAPA